MSICKYKYADTLFECQEDALEESDYCVLHTEFPEYRGSLEYKVLLEEKNKKIKEKIENKDFDFTGAILPVMNFEGIKDIEEDMSFRAATIISTIVFAVYFANTIIKGEVDFSNAIIDGAVCFKFVEIDKTIFFNEAIIKGDAWFNGAKIVPSFHDTIIEGIASFNDATISKTLIDDVLPDSSLYGSYFSGNLDNLKAEEFQYDRTKFVEPLVQRNAFRNAKHHYEQKGDKLMADYFFYLEMEGNRRSKPFILRYPELLVQYCFGYGVYPFRVIGTTLVVAFIFAFIFWLGNGLIGANTPQAYIYFSFINALKLGSLEFQPANGTFQLLATLEAIIGTFLWAAFVGTFARKFMR